MTDIRPLRIEVDYACSSNDLKRQKLVALLNKNTDDEILVDREFLSSVYARLGNDSLLLNKLATKIENVHNAHGDLS